MADNHDQNGTAKTTSVVTKPNSSDPAVERKLREMKSHFPLKEQEAHYLVCIYCIITVVNIIWVSWV